ncbi:hypothetical protein N7U66_12495 [Lacinutrix neustonica]|uniref:FTP domain-containing protein n=1 Tax=Lacinutrix neustonica TaxID=2980107 RepID=A0A9E8MT62_9FLAO|nr:hypothetical protein [Lacinutrix neustonica]WAC01003.1 hypothetical protein N7U66_12495 [Lacinutrix neustonica]
MKQKLVFLVLVSITMLSYAQHDKDVIALKWLTANQTRLGIHSNHSFKMLFSTAGLSGETFRFYQMINGVQVYGAEVTIHVSNDNNVTFHQSTYDRAVATINTTPTISKQKAIHIAETTHPRRNYCFRKE